MDLRYEIDNKTIIYGYGDAIKYATSLRPKNLVGKCTRTSVYDKSRGSALNFVKDTDEYKTATGEINHSEFYGYTTYPVTDYSRSEINKTTNETYYPYTKTEEAVSLNAEIDALRQAVYELTQRLNEVCAKDNSYSWC